jgi:hypothetical protein
MGMHMKKNTKLITVIIFLIMILVTFSPYPSTVYAALTDTITVTFDPEGNVSIEVSPSTYDFGTIYTDSSESTTATYFTIWNNGTIDNMFTDIRITSGTTNFTIDDDSEPASDDNYAVKVLQGSVDHNPWIAESTYRDLDDDIDRVGSDNFGITLYISNITSEFSEDGFTITLQGAQS